ncbi:MAG: ABC transporter substrate-binding protein [Fretibacterium sp.]|nr:ABC transporter substrate-binding protein [Fretibacterium sp.]
MKRFLKILVLTAVLGVLAAAPFCAEADSGKIPEFYIAWGHELHTGNMELAFLRPDAFKDNPCFLRPVTDSRLELVRDGKVIAYFNRVISKNAAESSALMVQGHIQFACCSSTAMMTTYDAGTDVVMLCPVQSGGVAFVASAKAPYNTFEELVKYAKEQKMPVMAGYHSAISSPRIVLEYVLRDAGLKVTENPADYDADVLIMDLKGLKNLLPSLSSGQVELWPGPIPMPENAEAQGIGKIIAKLDDLPGGKWVDFPCCTMNTMKSVVDEYPEVVMAFVQATTDLMAYAQNNREDTAKALADFVGVDVEILKKNDTTYTTLPDKHFTDGMDIYLSTMTSMKKLNKRLAGKTFDDVKDILFDFRFTNKVKR